LWYHRSTKEKEKEKEQQQQQKPKHPVELILNANPDKAMLGGDEWMEEQQL
jgi:hypothetical protein